MRPEAGTPGKPIRTKLALEAGSGGLQDCSPSVFLIGEDIKKNYPSHVTVTPSRCAVKDL